MTTFTPSQTSLDIGELFANQFMKPHVDTLASVCAWAGIEPIDYWREGGEDADPTADDCPLEPDQIMVWLAADGYLDRTTPEPVDSDQELQEWLRDQLDHHDLPEWAEEQLFSSLEIDDTPEWQEAPCYLEDWSCNAVITSGYATDHCGLGSLAESNHRLHNSDGEEVDHCQRDRRHHVAKRIQRLIDTCDNPQVMWCNPGFIGNCPKYGQVVNGVMIAGVFGMSGEVELTGSEGQGLGVYVDHHYAYFVVGVPVDPN